MNSFIHPSTSRPTHQPLQVDHTDHCSSSYDSSSSSSSSTPSASSSRNSSLSVDALPLTPEATSNSPIFPGTESINNTKPHTRRSTQPEILHPHTQTPRFGRAQPTMSENQINRVKLQEMMNLIEAQRIETEQMGQDEDDATVCVNIVMTVKPEWIHEVKFLIKSGKKWAEAHEQGLLTFRATVGVDNPCEIRLFQEFLNLDAYREHELNPFNQEMVNGLADYLEEDMVFIEGEEFAL